MESQYQEINQEFNNNDSLISNNRSQSQFINTYVNQNSMTITSEMGASKGYIFENPDGTLFQLKPVYEKKPNINENNLSRLQKNPLNLNQMIVPIIVEEEFGIYIPHPQDRQGFVDDVLHLYKIHSRRFLWFLLMQFIFEMMIGYYGYITQHHIIAELQLIYEGISEKELAIIYWTFVIMDMIFSVLYYPIAWLSVKYRSVNLYTVFSTLALSDLIVEMLLAYVNRFNICLFMARILSYMYSKYLCHLIINILVLPRHD